MHTTRCPAILLDRDGVLNKRPPRAHYVRAWDEFEWLPGARDALRLLNGANFHVIVVTNQAGISRGLVTEEAIQRIHRQMVLEAAREGGRIDAVYYCPHQSSDGCECRKPKPGLVFQAQRTFSLELSQTLLVGDDEVDAQAAKAAGCPWALVSPERLLLDIVRELTSRT